MKYTVYGQMYVKKEWKSFIKELSDESESRVREQVLTRLGADHRLKRTQIRITTVEGVSA